MRDTTQIRAHHLVDALAHGDRSIGFALHSLLMAADDAGVAPLNRVAVVYRDDYIASLRAEGKNADQEAGRLSLDEVRAHLLRSVLPRLAGEGVVTVRPGTVNTEPIVTFAPAVWTDLVPARAELTAALKVSSEHPAVTSEAPMAGNIGTP